MLNDEDNEKASSIGAARYTIASDDWIALFGKGNLGAALVISGGVAIHALSLRVVAAVLPSAVTEIGGLRFHSRSWPVRHCLPLLAVRQSAPELQNLSSVEEVPSEIAN